MNIAHWTFSPLPRHHPMKRHLVLLVALLLSTLRLAATDIDPDSYYRAVTAQDKPAGWSDGDWKTYTDAVRAVPNMTIDGNSIVFLHPKTSGKNLLEYLDPNVSFNKFLPSRLVSAEKIPAPGEESKAKLEAEDKASDAEDNRPPPVSDGKGIPLLSTRDAPFADENTPVMKGTGKNKGAKSANAASPGNVPMSDSDDKGIPLLSTRDAPFADENTPGMEGTKKSKAPKPAQPADFPEEEDKRPLSQRIMNTGKKPAPAAAVAPAAQADDEDERPLAASGNKFSKPKTGQGTKKDDTLFKNQNQNNPPQHQAPNSFIGIWAYPKDRGKGDDDYRLVFVQLTGKDTPDLMSLKNAKKAGYVPESLRYTTLSLYPE